MDCGMMSGIGSRIFFLGVRAMSAVRHRTIDCSSTQSLSLSCGHLFFAQSESTMVIAVISADAGEGAGALPHGWRSHPL